MEHELAITTRAVERYLLDEMSAEERSAFEDHYFACEACATDLRLSSRFIDNAKAIWREEANKPAKVSAMDWLRAKWLSPAMATLAAAALAVVVYQNTVTLPALNAPRALPAVTLDLTSRAALPRLGSRDPLHFYIAAERPINSPRLWAELSTEVGKVMCKGSIPAPKPDQPIDVYFPGTLEPGRYIIAIRSLRSDRPDELIARKAFEVARDQEHTNE